MLFAFGDDRVGRQRPIGVQPQMKFHRSLRQAELGPIKHRGAEIDPRGMQAQPGVLETEFLLLSGFWLPGRQGLTLRQQLLKHRAMQLPRTMLIGVGQGGARRSRGQPQMTEFPFAGRQAPINFAQRLGVSQLTEEHGDELAPASETTSVRPCRYCWRTRRTAARPNPKNSEISRVLLPRS